ncbi:MAG: hypothetical protein IJ272_08405 [Clostridia bacterium]|nr:hypothetical protein [Clostridia bacterium]
MIDLHTHTKYSDGTWDLKRLLLEANQAGVEVLSITDHDTLKPYGELKDIDYKSIYAGIILPGVELSTIYGGVKFELLAYGFDYTILNEWIVKTYENKSPDLNLEFEFMYKSCKRNDIKIGDLHYDVTQGWPVDIIYEEIKKYDENRKYFSEQEWNDVDVFYNSCITNRDFPAYVDFSIHFPTADIVAKKVREAGGKVFIAHAYKYKLNDTIAFLDTLKNDNIIDGVEVYHSTFNDDEVKKLQRYCKDNNLLMSGGSDCHGDKKSTRKIGVGYGKLKTSKDILKAWNIQDRFI